LAAPHLRQNVIHVDALCWQTLASASILRRNRASPIGADAVREPFKRRTPRLCCPCKSPPVRCSWS
jgi:hypothetical protein